MSQIPAEHITDAHLLQADGEIDLYELTPLGGGGTIYFKSDNTVTWRGNEYGGVPLKLSGLKESMEGGAPTPRLMIGQEDLNLSPFKPLIFDGSLDNATVVRKRMLVASMLANTDIKQSFFYRVKRVESYGRTSLSLLLASLSDSLNFTTPSRAYYPPDFPAVFTG